VTVSMTVTVTISFSMTKTVAVILSVTVATTVVHVMPGSLQGCVLQRSSRVGHCAGHCVSHSHVCAPTACCPYKSFRLLQTNHEI
jgi:hypothetical protein